MSNDNNQEKKLNLLIEKLESQEQRIRRIEAFIKNEIHTDLSVTPVEQAGDYGKIKSTDESDSSLEANVVEYGLAWLSSIVYLLGIIFLMTYAVNNGHPWISSAIGYGAIACIFILSNLLRKSFPHLIYVLTISGLLLVYYITLRLHFFSLNPVVPDATTGILLLLAVTGIQVYFSVRNRSESIATIALLSGLATALFSDSTYVTLSVIALISFISVVFFVKSGWWRLMILTIIFIYLAYLIWFFNNPVMGHPFQAVSSPQYSLIYLFGYAIIFSSIILFHDSKALPDNIYVAAAIINALGFIMTIFIEVFSFYENKFAWIFIIISVLSLVYSILLKSRIGKLFAPAFYACLGFMTLSIGLYGFVKFPNAYFLLAMQSFLVVSFALWFRSKIIVVVNTLIFLLLLIMYFINSPSITVINFVFAFIALITARILNWKKERLTLKTDLLRNLYLIEGFFMVLYGLQQAVSGEFVTLSWTLAAVFFLLLSILLKNVKYRWMSIVTILFTGLHFLLVDMVRMQIGYRIIASLFFAAITLGVSLYYTKRIKKKKNSQL